MDLSQGMLDEARAAGHYDKLAQGSLDEPLPHPPNSVDILSCIGTLSYIRADGPCMSEWCRVVRSGGLIVFTHRGPYDTEPPYYEEAGWKAAQEGLVGAGKWEKLSESAGARLVCGVSALISRQALAARHAGPAAPARAHLIICSPVVRADVPYLPDHPEFGAGGSASLSSCRIFVYRVC